MQSEQLPDTRWPKWSSVTAKTLGATCRRRRRQTEMTWSSSTTECPRRPARPSRTSPTTCVGRTTSTCCTSTRPKTTLSCLYRTRWERRAASVFPITFISRLTCFNCWCIDSDFQPISLLDRNVLSLQPISAIILIISQQRTKNRRAPHWHSRCCLFALWSSELITWNLKIAVCCRQSHTGWNMKHFFFKHFGNIHRGSESFCENCAEITSVLCFCYRFPDKLSQFSPFSDFFLFWVSANTD